MPDLPALAEIDQLGLEANELLEAARAGDRKAITRIQMVNAELNPASAQGALAQEYGFASWSALEREVDRRRIIDNRDVHRLHALLIEHPELATDGMKHWCDHPPRTTPLSYVAMLRYDTSRRIWRDVPGTGAIARALLEAGASVDGGPDDRETPLITAASYGDTEVAQVLIEAGANLEATAAANAGGVPGGTALRHAAVFGMTGVVDLLVAAGARASDISVAAATGDLSGWLRADTSEDDRIRALIMAADHERLGVIDQLVAAGTPVDAVDARWGRQALRLAAQDGRFNSVRRLLEHGADPSLRDSTHHRTALDWCRTQRATFDDTSAHDQVEAMLEPLAESASKQSQ